MAYALAVALLSLVGAAIPLRFRPRHASLQLYLSLAAGTLLGAAMFHLLPEAAEHIGGDFALPATLGVVVVFLLQRYLAPHSHELSADPPEPEPAAEHAHEATHGHHAAPDHHAGHERPAEHGHHAGHDHHAEPAEARTATQERLHSHGPFLSGMVAILALSIHSLFDGIAVGAVTSGDVPRHDALMLAVLLSVIIHKPLDGLSVSVLLLHAGVRTSTLWLVQGLYALLVPLGALAFHATSGAVAEAGTVVGYCLAFSAGTFLAVALTDLLPELHFHHHDRHKLSAALLAGLLIMWATSLLGHPAEHSHDEGDHNSAEHRHDAD